MKNSQGIWLQVFHVFGEHSALFDLASSTPPSIPLLSTTFSFSSLLNLSAESLLHPKSAPSSSCPPSAWWSASSWVFGQASHSVHSIFHFLPFFMFDNSMRLGSNVPA